MATQFIRCSATAAILGAAIWLPAQAARAQLAQPTQQQAERPEEMVLVTHEVGDLVVDVPDYNAEESQPSPASGMGAFGGGGGGMGGGGMGGGGGGMGGAGLGGGGRGGAARADVSGVSLDQLIDAIVATIAHDSWAENGGGTAQIRPVGTTLVVWQDRRAQEEISHLLDALRNGSAGRRSVTIDARWLLLDSDDLERLAVADDAGETSIDRDVLAEFTRRPTSLRAITNCFSGQRVYLVSGTRRTVVSGYIPVVGSIEEPEATRHWASYDGEAQIAWAQTGGGAAPAGRGVGYQPIVEKPNFGAMLTVRPTLMQGENAAVVDLTSTVTFGGPEPDNGGGRAAAPAVDRVSVDRQELATTLRAPLNRPTLVGGMSYLGDANGAAATDASDLAGAAPAAGSHETPQLYLVLEVR